MMGDKNSEDLKGIIPRSAEEIFKRIVADASGITYTVTASYLEVYREKIGDLLGDRSNPKTLDLAVREHPAKGIYVDGLSEKTVTSWEAVLEVLEQGDATRAVASTNMNAVSSRSHSVFIVNVQQENSEGSKKGGKLNLVDLAGSEKVGKTGAKGQTLEEAKKINQSLSALGQVIKALGERATRRLFSVCNTLDWLGAFVWCSFVEVSCVACGHSEPCACLLCLCAACVLRVYFLVAAPAALMWSS